MLTLPNGNKCYVVYNDAYKLGLSSVLMQHGKMVAYTSRQPKTQEQKYATHDMELVAMVFVFKLCRYYLYGSKFEVFTD